MAEFGIVPVLFLAGGRFLIYRFFFYVPRAVSDRSRAIRRLWLRTVLLLFLSIVLWLGLMILLLVGISSLLRWDIVWNGSASMAYILQTIRFLTPFLAIVGVVVISLLLFRKPFSYLQEIVQAAEQMQQEPEKPITLSAPVKTIQDELNRLRESSNQNALAAKEAEQRKNDLIVYLAHDLKTPLTSVIGYLSLLQDEPEISQELRAKYTGIALNKAQRLEELINQFFEITRFQLTHMELEWETIHFSRMLEQTAFEFQPILEEKHLQLQTEIAPDVKLTCDPDKLDDRGCKGAPDWIIEIVSPASRRMDYYTKLFKYRTAGVREYWIVDPVKKLVMVYDFENEDTEQYTFQDSIKVGIYEELRIDFAEM